MNVDRDALDRGEIPDVLHRLRHDAPHLHALELERELGGFQLGEIQDVVDQADQPLGVRLADGQELLLGRRKDVEPLVAQELQGTLDGGERRADLVGADRHELRLHAVQLLGPLVQVRVRDGDRGLAGEHRQELLIVRRERAPVPAQRRERPEDVLIREERHHERRPRLELGQEFLHADGSRDVRAAHGRGAPDGLAVEAHAVPEPVFAEPLGGNPHARLGDVLAGVRVVEEHQARLRARQLRDLVHDHLEGGLPAQAGADLLARLVERRDPLRRFLHHAAQDQLVLLELRVGLLEARDETAVLDDEEPALQPALDGLGGLPEVEGLRDVVVGPLTERVDGGRRGGVAGDEDDAGVLVCGLRRPDDLEPIHSRKVDVGEHEIEAAVRDLDDRVVPGLVVHHEDPGLRARRFGQHRGRRDGPLLLGPGARDGGALRALRPLGFGGLRVCRFLGHGEI